MLEQLKSQEFYVTSRAIASGKKNLNITSVPLLSLFLPNGVVKFIKQTLMINSKMLVGENQWYPGSFIYLVIVAIVLRIVYRKREDIKKYDGIIITILLSVLFISKLIPKQHLQRILGVIQFPWRILFIVTALISIYLGMFFSKVISKKVYSIFLGVFILSFYLYNGTYVYKIVYQGKSYNYEEYQTWKVGCGEYIPSLVENKKELKKRGATCVSNNNELEVKFHDGQIIFSNNKNNC